MMYTCWDTRFSLCATRGVPAAFAARLPRQTASLSRPALSPHHSHCGQRSPSSCSPSSPQPSPWRSTGQAGVHPHHQHHHICWCPPCWCPPRWYHILCAASQCTSSLRLTTSWTPSWSGWTRSPSLATRWSQYSRTVSAPRKSHTALARRHRQSINQSTRPRSNHPPERSERPRHACRHVEARVTGERQLVTMRTQYILRLPAHCVSSSLWHVDMPPDMHLDMPPETPRLCGTTRSY
mmetsp:Transcript_52896/g.105110  ORF Transcript_52896/g.105110 Transcript_52896/m.105110 type:complete len:237 (+) Transcript_52896:448-1158(+)